jgi:hypothetical protein
MGWEHGSQGFTRFVRSQPPALPTTVKWVPVLMRDA